MLKKYPLKKEKPARKFLHIAIGMSMVSLALFSCVQAEASQKKAMTKKEVRATEAQTLDLLATIDAFAEEDERLRADAAKAHYNMGNIYYQKGEFEIAVREYYQAVTLMPNDPDSHFNLAFVSGEHLNDFRTALKHYRMYLYLNPRAKDLNLVKEKIVKAELFLQGEIGSPLEKK